MKHKVLCVQLLTIAVLLMMWMGISSAYDAVEGDQAVFFSKPAESFTTQAANGRTVWRTDVNSDCSYYDYDIKVNIDVDPKLIQDPKLIMTNYDVDYNDPQGHENGPEVDIAYINGNRLPGILQGANNSWSVNQWSLDPSQLVKGENSVKIDVDSTNAGWCLGVGYVEISGMVGFNILKTTPFDGEENVVWENPEITIEFPEKIDVSTLYDNVLLRYRDDGAGMIPVDAVRDMAGDTVVRLTPNSKLMDGVKYFVTVKTGLKSQSGSQLQSDATFSFSTMVNLDGQTSTAVPPNTSKDKIQISWFNVAKDRNLVSGKKEVDRVYCLWEQKDGVWDADEVTEFKADVSLYVNGALLETQSSAVIQRDPAKNKRKEGKNTINFYHDTPSGGSETLKVVVHPVQNNYPEKQFEKSVTANIKGVGGGMFFTYKSCEMGSWFNGINADELASAEQRLGDAAEGVIANHPVIACTYSNSGKIVSGNSGFNMRRTGQQRNIRPNGAPLWVPEVESPPGSGKMYAESSHVMDVLKTCKGISHRFVVGLIPRDGLGGPKGVSRKDLHTVMLCEGLFDRNTLAHELAHEYNILDDFDGNFTNDVESFDVARKVNKSRVEGNSDDNMLKGLMEYVNGDYQRFIRRADYDHMLGQIVQNAQIRSTMFQEASIGNFLVVRGRFDTATGAILDTRPFYGVTANYIAAPTGTGYTAELFTGSGGTGTSLGRHDFGMGYMDIMPAVEGPEESIPDPSFVFTIPFDNSAQSLVLKGPKNTLTINRSDFGSAAPTCAFTFPTEGAVLKGTTTVSWTASDDSGTVYIRLEFSPDGTGWDPVSNELTGMNTTTVDLSGYASGTGKKLAIIAYDGFSTTRQEINVSVDNDLKVNYTYPANNSQNVGMGETVKAYFTDDIDVATLSKQTFTLTDSSGVQVAGNVFYNSTGREASLSPTANLKPNTVYTALLKSGSAGIKDKSGKTLTADYTWKFTTGKPKTGPYPLSVWPMDGGNNVPLNAIIQADFNQDVDPTSISASTFQVKDAANNAVAGSISYSSASWSAVFAPSASLAPNTTYTATLLGDIKNSEGYSLGDSFSWRFTTGNWSSTGVRIVKISGDQGIDKNADGLYDILRVLVHVEILKSGTYNLNGQLRDEDKADIAWSSVSNSPSAAGIYPFQLEFPGNVIAGHGKDGPYEIFSLSVYNVYDASCSHIFSSEYWTRAYKVQSFYSPIRLSTIPEIAVAMDSSTAGILDLTNYAKHQTYPSADLQYAILLNSNTKVGVSIDSSHKLNITPEAGFSGNSNVTVEVKDKDGNRALNSFYVSVIKNYKFTGKGWAAISMPNQPEDDDIVKVLKPIEGKYDIVWAYYDGQWRLYAPNDPGFSDLETMESGYGYWIYLNQAASFMSIGASVVKLPVGLDVGWNHAGFNSMENIPIASALSSIAGKYQLVWSYQDGEWKLYDPNDSGMSDLTGMSPGLSYWIKSLVKTNWTLK